MLLSVTAGDPSVTITAPFNSLTDTTESNYADFSKPITLSASASDPQDGANCCRGRTMSLGMDAKCSPRDGAHVIEVWP